MTGLHKKLLPAYKPCKDANNPKCPAALAEVNPLFEQTITAVKALYGEGKAGDLSKTAHDMLHMCEHGRRRLLRSFLPVQHKGHDCRSALAKMFKSRSVSEDY
jgi:hypothetical protein